MNYPESIQLLEKIKSSKNILLNCHESPDPDSISSALALREVLLRLGKNVKVICPDPAPGDNSFLPGIKSIEQVNFGLFDFSKFDLFIVLDTSDWQRVAKDSNFKSPAVFTYVIDNHISNVKFGNDRILDFDTSSVCEMLFNIFSDWNEEISQTIATYLYIGMIADTGCFQYQVKKNTFLVANELMNLGADKESVVFHLFRSYSYEMVKGWGAVINHLEIDKEYGFAWSAIPYEEIGAFGDIPKLQSISSTMFSRVINGTDFGIIMLEEKKNELGLSLRSRTDFDISGIAVELGGGGHKTAAGATLFNTTFEDGVKKVLEVAKKYAQSKKA